MKVIKSKSGKTACQIEYLERAVCSFFRFADLEWHFMNQEDYWYEQKGVLNDFIRRRLIAYDKIEMDVSESLFSVSDGLMQ